MFKKILLPIDLSETILAEKALKIAIDECKKNKSELHVLSIIAGFSMPYVASYFPKGAMEKVSTRVREELDEFIAKKIPNDIKVTDDIVAGEPAEEILEVAESLGIDLIIIPSHSRSIGQILLGSTARKVLAHAKCPVLVVKGE